METQKIYCSNPSFMRDTIPPIHFKSAFIAAYHIGLYLLNQSRNHVVEDMH